MDISTNRPRVFVSSTIVDFRDLRSAIKFWLEELGLQVRLSEFNDFVRRPEQDTFSSCFAAIEECHFFVLLIGGRKGSLYTDGVSVTQQEYRVAAELAKQGRISLVILARDEVKTALRERRSLSESLGQGQIRTEPSITVEDPPFTEQFIKEVEQTELKARGEDPSGSMWIYGFSNFRDVADALRNNLRLYGSVPRQTLLANLRWELTQNITAMVGKHNGMPLPGYWWIEKMRKSVNLTPNSGDQPIRLTEDDATGIIWFVVTGAPSHSTLQTAALRDAISSREFLFYDQSSRRLEPTRELDVMYRLLGEIESYQSAHRWWWETQLNRVVEQLRFGIRHGRAQIGELELLLIFAFHDQLVNIARLSVSLLDFIGEPQGGLVTPDLIDSSPYGKEESERIASERASHQDVTEWLKFEWTRRDITRTQARYIGIAEMRETFDQFPSLWETFARTSGTSIEEAKAQLKRNQEMLEIIADGSSETAFERLKEWLQNKASEDASG
jgi:hypothetical protein